MERVFPVRAEAGGVLEPALEVIEDVIEAAIQRRALDVRYRPARAQGKTVREYRLWPLAVLPHQGCLYLMARVPHRENILRFALHRFESVDKTTETFERPDEAQLKAAVDESFGIHDGIPVAVKLRFDPEVAHAVRERRWYHRQRLTAQEDGSVELSFTATGLPEIRGWVLHWGRFVEVIEPAELRREVAAEHRAALRRYGRR